MNKTDLDIYYQAACKATGNYTSKEFFTHGFASLLIMDYNHGRDYENLVNLLKTLSFVKETDEYAQNPENSRGPRWRLVK